MSQEVNLRRRTEYRSSRLSAQATRELMPASSTPEKRKPTNGTPMKRNTAPAVEARKSPRKPSTPRKTKSAETGSRKQTTPTQAKAEQKSKAKTTRSKSMTKTGSEKNSNVDAVVTGKSTATRKRTPGKRKQKATVAEAAYAVVSGDVQLCNNKVDRAKKTYSKQKVREKCNAIDLAEKQIEIKSKRIIPRPSTKNTPTKSAGDATDGTDSETQEDVQTPSSMKSESSGIRKLEDETSFLRRKLRRDKSDSELWTGIPNDIRMSLLFAPISKKAKTKSAESLLSSLLAAEKDNDPTLLGDSSPMKKVKKMIKEMQVSKSLSDLSDIGCTEENSDSHTEINTAETFDDTLQQRMEPFSLAMMAQALAPLRKIKNDTNGTGHNQTISTPTREDSNAGYKHLVDVATSSDMTSFNCTISCSTTLDPTAKLEENPNKSTDLHEQPESKVTGIEKEENACKRYTCTGKECISDPDIDLVSLNIGNTALKDCISIENIGIVATEHAVRALTEHQIPSDGEKDDKIHNPRTVSIVQRSSLQFLQDVYQENKSNSSSDDDVEHGNKQCDYVATVSLKDNNSILNSREKSMSPHQQTSKRNQPMCSDTLSINKDDHVKMQYEHGNQLTKQLESLPMDFSRDEKKNKGPNELKTLKQPVVQLQLLHTFQEPGDNYTGKSLSQMQQEPPYNVMSNQQNTQPATQNTLQNAHLKTVDFSNNTLETTTAKNIQPVPHDLEETNIIETGMNSKLLNTHEIPSPTTVSNPTQTILCSTKTRNGTMIMSKLNSHLPPYSVSSDVKMEHICKAPIVHIEKSKCEENLNKSNTTDNSINNECETSTSKQENTSYKVWKISPRATRSMSKATKQAKIKQPQSALMLKSIHDDNSETTVGAHSTLKQKCEFSSFRGSLDSALKSIGAIAKNLDDSKMHVTNKNEVTNFDKDQDNIPLNILFKTLKPQSGPDKHKVTEATLKNNSNECAESSKILETKIRKRSASASSNFNNPTIQPNTSTVTKNDENDQENSEECKTESNSAYIQANSHEQTHIMMKVKRKRSKSLSDIHQEQTIEDTILKYMNSASTDDNDHDKRQQNRNETTKCNNHDIIPGHVNDASIVSNTGFNISNETTTEESSLNETYHTMDNVHSQYYRKNSKKHKNAKGKKRLKLTMTSHTDKKSELMTTDELHCSMTTAKPSPTYINVEQIITHPVLQELVPMKPTITDASGDITVTSPVKSNLETTDIRKVVKKVTATSLIRSFFANQRKETNKKKKPRKSEKAIKAKNKTGSMAGKRGKNRARNITPPPAELIGDMYEQEQTQSNFIEADDPPTLSPANVNFCSGNSCQEENKSCIDVLTVENTVRCETEKKAKRSKEHEITKSLTSNTCGPESKITTEEMLNNMLPHSQLVNKTNNPPPGLCDISDVEPIIEEHCEETPIKRKLNDPEWHPSLSSNFADPTRRKRKYEKKSVKAGKEPRRISGRLQVKFANSKNPGDCCRSQWEGEHRGRVSGKRLSVLRDADVHGMVCGRSPIRLKLRLSDVGLTSLDEREQRKAKQMAYTLWLSDNRRTHQQMYGDLTSAELNDKLTQKWASLSDNGKKAYYDKAEKLYLKRRDAITGKKASNMENSKWMKLNANQQEQCLTIWRSLVNRSRVPLSHKIKYMQDIEKECLRQEMLYVKKQQTDGLKCDDNKLKQISNYIRWSHISSRQDSILKKVGPSASRTDVASMEAHKEFTKKLVRHMQRRGQTLVQDILQGDISCDDAGVVVPSNVSSKLSAVLDTLDSYSRDTQSTSSESSCCAESSEEFHWIIRNIQRNSQLKQADICLGGATLTVPMPQNHVLVKELLQPETCNPEQFLDVDELEDNLNCAEFSPHQSECARNEEVESNESARANVLVHSEYVRHNIICDVQSAQERWQCGELCCALDSPACFLTNACILEHPEGLTREWPELKQNPPECSEA